MYVYDINGNSVAGIDEKTPIGKNLTALKYHFNETEGTGTWTNYNTYDNLVVAHLSDIHSDTVRYERFLRFAQKNKALINCAVVTGDFVGAPNAQCYGELTTVEADYTDVDLLKCLGNHEKYTYGYQRITTQQAYNYLGLSTDTGEPYYYKDYTSQKIRMIVLNPYDSTAEPNTSQYSQAQIDWFINALKSAKSNDFSVIVCRHNFDREISVSNNKGFYQRYYQWAPQLAAQIVCSGTPVEDIIDAFKNGTSINRSYTYTDDTPTITVNTTFSGTGDFICYISGHAHADLIGYSPNYSDQLYLCVSIGSHGSTTFPQLKIPEEASDMPRNNEDWQDLFNVYGIDKKNRLIKVCRVGADVNDLLEDRKVAVFEY